MEKMKASIGCGRKFSVARGLFMTLLSGMLCSTLDTRAEIHFANPTNGSVFILGNSVPTISVVAVADGQWNGAYLSSGSSGRLVSPDPGLSSATQTVFRLDWTISLPGPRTFNIYATNGITTITSAPVVINVQAS